MMSTSPEASKPTQDQLHRLHDTVLSYEPDIPPFAGIPPGIDLRRFVQLTGPPTFDEKLAPAATLKAPDKRVIWLAIFRNPDTNAIAKTTILVLDPPVNRSEREELPSEDYTIVMNSLGRLAIERENAPSVTAPEVLALQALIDTSEQCNTV